MTNWFTQEGKVLTDNGKIRGCCCGTRRTTLLITNHSMFRQIIKNSDSQNIGYNIRTRSSEYRLYGTNFVLYSTNLTVICSNGTQTGPWYSTPLHHTEKKYITTPSFSPLKVTEYINGVTTEVLNMTFAEIEAEKAGTVLFSGTIYSTWNDTDPCNSGEETCTITRVNRYE